MTTPTTTTTSQVDEEFKNAVRGYVELVDQKAAKTNEIKEINKQVKAFEEAILTYMQQNEIEGCKLKDGGKLLRTQSRRVSAIKVQDIKEALQSTVGEQQADAVMLNIVGKRPVTTVEKLKRTKTRTKQGGAHDDDD
jgi:hypothetical protein